MGSIKYVEERRIYEKDFPVSVLVFLMEQEPCNGPIREIRCLDACEWDHFKAGELSIEDLAGSCVVGKAFVGGMVVG